MNPADFIARLKNVVLCASKKLENCEYPCALSMDAETATAKFSTPSTASHTKRLRICFWSLFGTMAVR